MKRKYRNYRSNGWLVMSIKRGVVVRREMTYMQCRVKGMVQQELATGKYDFVEVLYSHHIWESMKPPALGRK